VNDALHGAVLSAQRIEALSDPSKLPEGTAPLIEDLCSDNLKGAAYDLRMADSGMVLPNGKVVRPTELPYGSDVLLEPGQTVFVSTRERLNLPKNLTGNMYIKGELAREGILSLTGLIVDPGYHVGGSKDGRLHFRLANLGSRPVLLQPGRTKIASIQFVQVTDTTDREPGKSFDDLWARADELKEGLGFVEDLRALRDRVEALEIDVTAQRRVVNYFVIAGLLVVVTTLLGVALAGLLSLGADSKFVDGANGIVPDNSDEQWALVAGLFGIAAIAFAVLSPIRVAKTKEASTPYSLSYASREALRQLRAQRVRRLSLAGALLGVLVVATIGVIALGVVWWIPVLVVLGIVAASLKWAWDAIWIRVSGVEVEQLVRDWESST
jgi:deoxycytidine triphosphate deaminase